MGKETDAKWRAAEDALGNSIVHVPVADVPREILVQAGIGYAILVLAKVLENKR